MTEEQERQAFLKALKEDPYDKASHDAFADWLFEHGEDDLAHYHSGWTKQKQESHDWI